MERLLIAPPPPRAAAPVQVQHATVPASALRVAPSSGSIAKAHHDSQSSRGGRSRRLHCHQASVGISGPGNGSGIPDGIPLGSPQPIITDIPPTPKHPVTYLFRSRRRTTPQSDSPQPIRRLQWRRMSGTVIIEATISRAGTIENLRVAEGPPMLRQAAIDAVAAARYRPFLLNGEPVEVQTSIRVIFSLRG